MFFRPKRTSNAPLTLAPSIGEMKYSTVSLGADVSCAPAALGSSRRSDADSKLLRVIPRPLPFCDGGAGGGERGGGGCGGGRAPRGGCAEEEGGGVFVPRP